MAGTSDTLSILTCKPTVRCSYRGSAVRLSFSLGQGLLGSHPHIQRFGDQPDLVNEDHSSRSTSSAAHRIPRIIWRVFVVRSGLPGVFTITSDYAQCLVTAR